MTTKPMDKNTAIKKLEPVIRDMIDWLVKGKIGNIQVNMKNGGISNWNLVESRKPEYDNDISS